MQLDETTCAVFWTLRENFHHFRFNYSGHILSGKKYRKVTPAFNFIHLEICSKNLKVFLRICLRLIGATERIEEVTEKVLRFPVSDNGKRPEVRVLLQMAIQSGILMFSTIILA